MITILNPALTMRKDGNRVVLYPGRDDTTKSTREFAYRFVDPRAAVVLSLFDGQRSREDVVSLWRELNDCDLLSAQHDVEGVLGDFHEFILDSEKVPPDFQPLDPEDFICKMAALDHSAARLVVPYSMLYLPTLLCGHNCRYCYADARKSPGDNELTPVELERLMDEAVSLRFSSVSFSGGDPFLRKDIFELIDIVFSHGFASDVPTKSPLTERQIQRLVDIGVGRIQISLDSPFDAEVVEHLTGRSNYFPAIMKTLMMLGESGFRVGITAVVTSLTIDSVPRMAEFYADLGFVNRVGFAQLSPSIYREFPELYPSPEKYEWLEAAIDPIKSKYSHIRINCGTLKDPGNMTVEERREWFEGRPVCSGGKYAFVLLPDGKVTVCEDLSYHPAFIVGDLRQQTIMEMWHSPEMLKLMRPEKQAFEGSPCYDCPTFYECHTVRGRCWKRALQGFRHMPAPEFWPDPFCPRAPKPHTRMF